MDPRFEVLFGLLSSCEEFVYQRTLFLLKFIDGVLVG